jgi:hypothetical protein
MPLRTFRPVRNLPVFPIDHNLAYIPLDFHPQRTSEFDPKYMDEEFALAHNLALRLQVEHVPAGL